MVTQTQFHKGRQVMIIAGEVSGDLHASKVLHSFAQKHPETRFFGVGGERMEGEGCELIYHVSEAAFLGLVEVLMHLPFIKKMMKRLLYECQQRKPEAIILVDYPGFNLRFAEKVRKIPGFEKIPILYYISPQVWAWHASRVPQIARLVDRIAVIFDFEVPIYEKAGLKADFVGHPLLEQLASVSDRSEFMSLAGMDPRSPLLALLPGSRLQEVKRLFSLFLETASRVKQKCPEIQIAVGCSPGLKLNLYQDYLEKSSLSSNIKLLQKHTAELQAHADAALVASGTATLETAICGTPMVMAYRVAPITYYIGKMLIKIPDIALVNVVAGKRVIPEYIQGEARPQALANELIDLLGNNSRREEMIRELQMVKSKLGEPGASARVAEILEELLNP